MAVFLDRPVKGKRFTQEFDVNDSLDQIIPKVGAGSVIGDAILNATPIATDTVQGKVALNLGTSLPGDATNTVDALTASGAAAVLNDTSVTGGNALQKAVVNAVEQSIAADTGAQSAIANVIADDIALLFPVATDTVQGKVALNLGTSLPGDTTNNTDALTAAGFIAMSSATGTPNAVQQAIVNALENTISSDTGAQTAIANAIVEEVTSVLPVAADTVQGKVALNLGTAMPGDANNSVDALTTFGFNAILNDTSTTGGNAMQKAVVNAVEQALSADTGAQSAIAGAIVDDLIGNTTVLTSLSNGLADGVTIGVNGSGKLTSKQSLSPSVTTGHDIADWTVNGVTTKVKETVTSIAVSGVNYVHTNEEGTAFTLAPGQFLSSDAGNALGVDSAGRIKVLIPAQLPDDQTFSGDNSGSVALELTPVDDGGQTNYVIKADLKVAALTPSNVASGLILGPSGFYVDVASDTLKGIVALNLGNDLPGDTTNAVDALTSAGLSVILNDSSLAGGNPVQQAVVNAVERSLAADTGAQAAIAAAIKDDIASAIAADATSMAALAAGFPNATDTVKGKVSLAVAENFPSTSDSEATTPAYVSQAVSNAVSAIPVIADATDTVKGKVSLAVAENFPSTSDTEAVTPAYLNEALANAAPNITASEEGTSLTTKMDSINFVGSAVTATATGNAVTVKVDGVTVSGTAPTEKYVGKLWQENVQDGRMYYWDGAQWVDTNPVSLVNDVDPFGL